MKTCFILTLYTALLLFSSCKENLSITTENKKIPRPIDWNNEIIYHVMPRSFFDSNGDLHGDLRGFVQQLDYLKELGVTTILFTPLYESDFYHNYFPINYKNIDPEYGTMDDYMYFIGEVHKRGLKFLMDMETQYAQSGNIWFDDSYKNTASKFSDFIYYRDSLNHYPEQIFMKPNSPLREFNLWPNKKKNIVLLNLKNQKIKDYMMDFYAFWVDPNQDGNFEDGVDGFRIDHIMDDLDYKGIFTNMYTEFWKPIFQKCKDINPSLFILGEQSNWNHDGKEMVEKSGADAAFNFPLHFAFKGRKGVQDMYTPTETEGVVLWPKRIHEVVLASMKNFNGPPYTINFLENHDTDRWASIVNQNEGQLRMGAVLNLLLPGIPSLYYGQELGLTGVKGDYGSDANHIPVREAFPWTPEVSAPGNALWYKETGPWWDNALWNSDALDLLNLNAQQIDSSSLWHQYKKLINIRTTYKHVIAQNYTPLHTDVPEIVAFKQTLDNHSLIVIVNASPKTVTLKQQQYEVIHQYNTSSFDHSLTLAPYGFMIAQSSEKENR